MEFAIKVVNVVRSQVATEGQFVIIASDDLIREKPHDNHQRPNIGRCAFVVPAHAGRHQGKLVLLKKDKEKSRKQGHVCFKEDKTAWENRHNFLNQGSFGIRNDAIDLLIEHLRNVLDGGLAQGVLSLDGRI